MRSAVWITYDLGVNGDYPALYEFLDSHKAKECGEACAFFEFDYKKALLPELTRKVKQQVRLKKGDRLYVIYRSRADDRLKGKFLSGSRKVQAPWAGYSTVERNVEDSDG